MPTLFRERTDSGASSCEAGLSHDWWPVWSPVKSELELMSKQHQVTALIAASLMDTAH